MSGDSLYLVEFWDKPIRDWCSVNCEGDWECAVDSIDSMTTATIAVYFEKEDDALMFQLSY